MVDKKYEIREQAQRWAAGEISLKEIQGYSGISWGYRVSSPDARNTCEGYIP